MLTAESEGTGADLITNANHSSICGYVRLRVSVLNGVLLSSSGSYISILHTSIIHYVIIGVCFLATPSMLHPFSPFLLFINGVNLNGKFCLMLNCYMALKMILYIEILPRCSYWSH